MQQPELPLYPKLSSIYNKIMQLAIAIVIIVVLMEVWLYASRSMEKTIEHNFTQTSRDYIAQVNRGLQSILISNELLADKQLMTQHIQTYIDESAQPEWIKDISYYGKTGQLLLSSTEHKTMNSLYGISLYQPDLSEQFLPFVANVRTENFEGYLRITMEREYFTSRLSQANFEHYDIIRLMMILAGLVGFLLTRGLNRFSRQGYRLNKNSNKVS
ncbi:AhpA/YtjB family protein [Thalassotalea piscium]|uniref:Membrane protein n=1 Tax=Thalassotalea piscium TaxID=1230533 RepID=A0A7X0NJY4_9GAMM|nr:AhpA/YtjB family protein [Thalassotalea piscium]MBB6544842.1 membrane protein [Thalassotalea piscium]